MEPDLDNESGCEEEKGEGKEGLRRERDCDGRGDLGGAGRGAWQRGLVGVIGRGV